MLYGKKKLAVTVFGLVYLVMFALLVWLFFFNQGLDIVQTTEGAFAKVFVKNTGNREINNVTVSAQVNGQKIQLAKIEKLSPNEMAEVDFSGLNVPQAVLIAEAPFYSPIEKTLVLGTSSEFDFTVQSPQLGFVNTQARFFVETCNNTIQEREVIVEIDAEEAFFEESFFSKNVVLPPKECKSETFDLLPTALGQTTINFNIKAANYNEKITKSLEVR